MRAAGVAQLGLAGGRLRIAPVSLTTGQLRSLREAHPRTLYSSRERVVTVPTGRTSGERIAAAESLLDALGGAVAKAA
jgi:hypothetical protein